MDSVSELDLMSTKDILVYLARHRFDGMVLAGIPRSNSQKEATVNCMIKGEKNRVELIQMDINQKLNDFLLGNSP